MIGESHVYVGKHGLEFGEAQIVEIERRGEHHAIFLDAVRRVHQLVGVQLEQAPVEPSMLLGFGRGRIGDPHL